MRFNELQLIDPLLRAINDQGYTEPTPIQAEAIPDVLAGRDLIGLAQTGTGKTAAFALPVLQRLTETSQQSQQKKRRFIRVLVLAPTRELASQIGKSFDTYGRYTPFKQTTIFGGSSQRTQVKKLKQGVDIVVATPGRLLDLMEQQLIRLDKLDILILDEADRMLDMGFLPDIKRIIAVLPGRRQTLLFSATMPDDIQKLTQAILTDPVQVAVTPESTTVDAVEQQVYFVEKSDKSKLLKYLLNAHNMHRTLVFTRTKRGADRLTKVLGKARIRSTAIHGNKSQRARESALSDFKRGKVQVLVATDIAARGIDVDDISHVVNFDLPNETESYVHRIGRTGRAGASGIALSFCAAEERNYLVAIERLIQLRLAVMSDHPYGSQQGIPQPTDLNGNRRSSKNRRPNKKRRSNHNGRQAHNGSNKGQSNNRSHRRKQNNKSTNPQA